jgi:hypothetical protein
MAKLEMTIEAAKLCTHAQFDSIVSQMGDDRDMRVIVDFSLPKGYLYFIRTTYNTQQVGGQIHGGIDPEGRIST